ncbi:MAG: DUF5615 family PIN-like protein [Lacunisphaera sp.]
MKLLFDQNLSSNLVQQISDLFPGSKHVKQIGMTRSDDSEIWAYARDHGFVLVSKDSDFQQRSLVLGAPPKVVWLRVGNCPSRLIQELLRNHSVELHAFDEGTTHSLMVLS